MAVIAHYPVIYSGGGLYWSIYVFGARGGKKRKLMIHFFALASFGFFWKFFSDLPVVMVMGPSQVNGFPVRYGLCNLLKFKSAKFNENIYFFK